MAGSAADATLSTFIADVDRLVSPKVFNWSVVVPILLETVDIV